MRDAMNQDQKELAASVSARLDGFVDVVTIAIARHAELDI